MISECRIPAGLPISDAAMRPYEDSDVRCATSGSFAAAIRQAYSNATLCGRARILERLLPHVRPLALAVLGGGMFARLLTRARWASVTLAADELSGVDADQAVALAQYVEQSSPGQVAHIALALSEELSTMPAVAAVFVVIAMRQIGTRAN